MAKTKHSKKVSPLTSLVVLSIVFCLSSLSYNAARAWQTERALWTETIKKSPLKSRPLTNLGYALYKDKNYELSEVYLTKAIQSNPEYYLAYNNLGRLYSDTSRLKEAESALKKSLSIVESPTAHNILGTVYRKIAIRHGGRSGAMEGAIQQYLLALRLKENYPEALNNLANAYYIKGDLQNSISAFKKAVQLNPYSDEIRNNLGLLYQSNKDYKEAEESFLKALSINKDNFKTYINLGTLYFTEKKFDQAINYYKLALKVNPKYYLGFYNIAAVYETEGKLKEALEFYKKAQFADPSHKIGREEIKRIQQ